MELVLPAVREKIESDRKSNGPTVVSVLSGKGGVGKTIVSANLAVALASKSRQVLLIDCDLSAGQSHLVLGLCPSCGLAHVVNGRKELKQVLMSVGGGLSLVPGGPPGGSAMELRGEQLRALMNSARASMPSTQVVFLDAGPGSVAVCGDFAAVADIPLVLTTPEPTAIRATVGLLEAMLTEQPQVRPYLLVNMAASKQDAVGAFRKITGALLPVFISEPKLFGWLPYDLEVTRSLGRYRAVVTDTPRSRAARGFRRLRSIVIEYLEGSGLLTQVSGDEERGEGTCGSEPDRRDQKAREGSDRPKRDDQHDSDEALAA